VKEQITMAEKNPEALKPNSTQSLTDDQMITERKRPRRSFLSASGALVVGAAAIASGVRAAAQNTDPDKKPPTDPDQKKPSDPDQRKPSDPDQKKPSDPDQKKPSDPDQRKPSDPDQKKPSDPDQKKPSDPDKKARGRSL
jgi:hypothetical protein